MDEQAIAQAVRRILSAPGVDLSLISSKKVRAQLSETFNPNMIKEHKTVCLCDRWCRLVSMLRLGLTSNLHRYVPGFGIQL